MTQGASATQDYPLGGIPVMQGRADTPPDERRATSTVTAIADSAGGAGRDRPGRWQADWQQIVDAARRISERIVVNMGPQHPSARRVLQFIWRSGVLSKPGAGNQRKSREEPRIPVLGLEASPSVTIVTCRFSASRLLPRRGEATRHH